MVRFHFEQLKFQIIQSVTHLTCLMCSLSILNSEPLRFEPGTFDREDRLLPNGHSSAYWNEMPETLQMFKQGTWSFSAAILSSSILRNASSSSRFRRSSISAFFWRSWNQTSPGFNVIKKFCRKFRQYRFLKKLNHEKILRRKWVNCYKISS